MAYFDPSALAGTTEMDATSGLGFSLLPILGQVGDVLGPLLGTNKPSGPDPAVMALIQSQQTASQQTQQVLVYGALGLAALLATGFVLSRVGKKGGRR